LAVLLDPDHHAEERFWIDPGEIMLDNCLILMVKCPREGEVKRRLSTSIGEKNAVEIYKRSGLDVLDTIRDLDLDVKIGFYPPDDRECIRSWLGDDLELIPQLGKELGEKQSLLLQEGFNLGYQKVCVMISDSPDIPGGHISSAFDRLSNADCVIGPSPDGGYYLIGFTRKGFQKEPFLNMKWSHGEVKKEMERRLGQLGVDLVEIEKWQDVDDLPDLKDLIARNPEDTGPKRTMDFLRRFEFP
jgi:uncharacterized protein